MKAKAMSLSGSAATFLADGAKAWNLSWRMIIVIGSLPFIVAFSAAGIAVANWNLYRWLTGSDGLALSETIPVLLWCLDQGLGLVIARHLWKARSLGIAFLYLCLSIGIFVVIGEKLNWGQSVARVEASEPVAAVNMTGEIALDHLSEVEFAFHWGQLLAGAYGTIMPLVFFRPTRLARYRETISMLVPHCTLIPYFLLLFLWRIYRSFMEPPQGYRFAIAEYNEIMELNLALGVFLFMVFQLRRIRARQETAMKAATLALEERLA